MWLAREYFLFKPNHSIHISPYAKKHPFYRIVAADSRAKRDGRFIEVVGTYNPLTDPAEIKIDEEVAMKWLKSGATPTDTVRNILSKNGTMAKFAKEKQGK